MSVIHLFINFSSSPHLTSIGIHTMPSLHSGLVAQIWQTLTRAPPHSKEPKLLTKLPLELLLKITTYTPLPSQVCLALTCKCLYQILHVTALTAKELRFPYVSTRRPAFYGDRYYLSRAYCLRMELLILLEDAYWVCCAYCQKLHPRRELHPLRLEQFPLRRECTSGAGLVDLCPCLVLTLRSREWVLGYLLGRVRRRGRGRGKPYDLEAMFKGRLRPSCTENGVRCLEHDCNIYSTVTARIVVFVEKGDRLIARTRYELPSAAVGPQMEAIYCCRHYDLWDYAYIMLWLFSFPRWRCRKCLTLTRVLLRTPDSTVVTLTRDLGRGFWHTDPGSDILTHWPPQVRFLTDYIPIPHSRRRPIPTTNGRSWIL